MFDEIISKGECYNISMLDIKGDEIINLGASGKQTGEVLSTLLDMVISEQIPNENKILIQKVKENLVILKQRNSDIEILGLEEEENVR